jgi:hypothetical protein
LKRFLISDHLGWERIPVQEFPEIAPIFIDFSVMRLMNPPIIHQDFPAKDVAVTGKKVSQLGAQ